MPGWARSASRTGSLRLSPTPCRPDGSEERAMRFLNLRIGGLVAALLCIAGGASTAQQAVVTPLMTKELADIPDKEAQMITVECPPGSSDPVHRHNAQAFSGVRLRAGGLGRDAAERRKAGNPDTGTDVL